MADTKNILNNFTGGEVSPEMQGRYDIVGVYNSAEEIQNSIVEVHGAVRGRNGTHYIGETKDQNANTRLISFVVNRTDTYMLEFGNYYMRVYKGYALVESAPSVIFEIGTAFAAADLDEIQQTQREDVMFFAHPKYPVQRLIRYADDNWRFEPYNFKTFAFQDFVVDVAAAQELFANYAFDNSVEGWTQVSSSGDFFWTSSYGAYTGIAVVRRGSGGNGFHQQKSDLEIGEEYTLTPLIVRSISGSTINVRVKVGTTPGGGEVLDTVIKTGGSGGNTVVGEYPVSYTATATSHYVTLHVTGLTDFTIGGIVLPGEIYVDRYLFSSSPAKRLKVSDAGNGYFAGEEAYLYASGIDFQENGLDTYLNAVWKLRDPNTPSNIVRVKYKYSIASDQIVVELLDDVEIGLRDVWTDQFAENCWNNYRGYSRAINQTDNRLVLGGTAYQPRNIWMSKQGIYDVFESPDTITATSPLDLQVSSKENNTIKWFEELKGQGEGLLIGTERNEFLLYFDTANANFPVLRPKTTIGTSDVLPVSVESRVIFADYVREAVLAYVYSFGQDGYQALKLNRLAPHITKSKIKKFAVQQGENMLLWALRDDGVLVGCTISEVEQVSAFQRHFVADDNVSIVDMEVLRGELADELWVIAKRHINSVNKYYVEVIRTDKPNNYADCVTEYSGAAVSVITGLDHLAGESVQVIKEGEYIGDYDVVDAGGGNWQIDISPEAVTSASIGLCYTRILTPRSPHVAELLGGAVNLKKLSAISYIGVYNSYGIEYRTITDSGNPVKWFSIDYRGKDKDVVYSEYKYVTNQGIRLHTGAWDNNPKVSLRQIQPYPFYIQVMRIDIELGNEHS